MVPEGLVLLTSLAFVVAAVTLARQQTLVQELPAVEGLARVDVVCLDKTGTLTDGDIAFDRLQPLDGRRRRGRPTARSACPRSGRRRQRHVRGARGCSSPTRLDARRPRCRSRRRASGRRQRLDGQGTWVIGAPEMVLPDADRRQRRRRPAAADEVAARRRVAASLAQPRAPRRRRSRPTAGNCVPRALVVLAEQIREDAAETLRYFAEQGVALKVISGDNPRTVGAVAGGSASRCAARRRRRRCPRPARGPRRAGRRPRGAQRVRPGDPAAEAGHGRGAAAPRARGRDDRRRRERRAGAQGRRHRRRDGQRLAGDPGGRAARAARRQVLAPARRASPRAGG